MTLALAGAMVSCYFDAARDNPNDPESGDIQQNDIFLFSTSEQGDGSFTGRSGANTLCRNRRNEIFPKLPSNNVYAFISINSSDHISNMDSNYLVPINKAIKGPTGIVIANDWNDLLDGSILETLSNASITSISWWSASNSDGSLHDANCTNFDGTAGQGRVGYATIKNEPWITGFTVNCTETNHVVLCICWN